MRNVKLPNKPSKLLKVALEDLEAVEKDLKYRIDMNSWHQPEDNKCSVCLAGAVMANRLRCDIEKALDPYDLLVDGNIEYWVDLRNKLEAIDYFCRGKVEGSLLRMGIKCPESLKNCETDYYNYTSISPIMDVPGEVSSFEDKKAFKIYIQSLIGILESEGL